MEKWLDSHRSIILSIVHYRGKKRISCLLFWKNRAGHISLFFFLTYLPAMWGGNIEMLLLWRSSTSRERMFPSSTGNSSRQLSYRYNFLRFWRFPCLVDFIFRWLKRVEWKKLKRKTKKKGEEQFVLFPSGCFAQRWYFRCLFGWLNNEKDKDKNWKLEPKKKNKKKLEISLLLPNTLTYSWGNFVDLIVFSMQFLEGEQITNWRGEFCEIIAVDEKCFEIGIGW